ncbi:MAG: hypothetical protein KGO81_01230 [Bacteroidota bacterium]|nr:hypothetical protein [Bacteroidota bacterium]
MEKTCPYSGIQFKPKRRNQVFASPQNRIRYHNENAAKAREMEQDIKKIRNNLKILASLGIKNGERKSFDKDLLLKKGYDPFAVSRLFMFENTLCSRVEHYVLLKSSDNKTFTFVNLK